jgi:hypothetical protein
MIVLDKIAQILIGLKTIVNDTIKRDLHVPA